MKETLNLIRSKTRKREVVIKRQAFCYFLNVYKGLSHDYISKVIHRDRTTVIYSVNTFKDLLSIYPEYKSELDFIIKTKNTDLIFLNQIIKENKDKLSEELIQYLQNYEPKK